MESVREIYKIGNGPSSSHTMGPSKAALIFKERNPSAASFHVTLYGSLAATGKGHLTDKAIIESMAPVPVEISWKASESIPPHPNGMIFRALDKSGTIMQEWTTFSIGGGDISVSGRRESKNQVYEMSTMKETGHDLPSIYRETAEGGLAKE
jgi:L-serine dehydratase